MRDFLSKASRKFVFFSHQNQSDFSHFFSVILATIRIPESGLKAFFDVANTMQGTKEKPLISLGVGEPDFQTPEHIKKVAVESILAGRTKYTNNLGLIFSRFFNPLMFAHH